METATTLHAVPHWERINPIKSRVEIAFDLSVHPARTSVEQLRRALFTTLNNDALPQIAKAAPAGADLHVVGSANSDFDVASVDFNVPRDLKGKWRMEAGEKATLSGSVAIDLTSDYPTSPAGALETVRASVADEIAALIAESFSQIASGQVEERRKAA